MKLDIVINTDDNYIQHAMATLCSLFENNISHHIRVHVLQSYLSEKSRCYLSELAHRYNNNVAFYSVDESCLKGVQFRKNRPLSMAAYYRLLLASILPSDLDKVLYMDCDMIILQDISEIFQIEIDDYALAATLDRFPYSQQHRLQLHMEVGENTFCSGIMLVNLKYWRENNVEEGLLEYAKRHREVVYLHDQDVLNYYFKKKWFLLPPKWNHTACSIFPIKDWRYKPFDIVEYIQSPILYHYASVDVKPWYDMPSPNRAVYLKFLKMSGFKELKFDKQSRIRQIMMFLRTNKYELKRLIFSKLYLSFHKY
jgi:lipopolysaccharide biosynthesis glycosyltransferase